jgi:hypothetical protein
MGDRNGRIERAGEREPASVRALPRLSFVEGTWLLLHSFVTEIRTTLKWHQRRGTLSAMVIFVYAFPGVEFPADINSAGWHRLQRSSVGSTESTSDESTSVSSDRSRPSRRSAVSLQGRRSPAANATSTMPVCPPRPGDSRRQSSLTRVEDDRAGRTEAQASYLGTETWVQLVAVLN